MLLLILNILTTKLTRNSLLKLKILFVSPEVTPLARTGGLGDVVGSLPLALKEIGIDVRLICPLYNSCKKIQRKLYRKKISFKLGKKNFSFSISSTALKESNTPVYFIENKQLFSRDGIYSDESGNFSDNAIRAFALSRAAIELEKVIEWKADVFHAHDWMASPTCGYLNSVADTLERSVASVLTIHNLEHQGTFSHQDFQDSYLPEKYWGMDGFEHNGNLNLLKGGIQHATKLTTVSPTYAKEIRTVSFGEGLEKSLVYRAGDLIGVLNGIDEKAWDPLNDSYLTSKIDPSFPEEGKKKCKLDLQSELNLKKDHTLPILGVVSRLYQQKGLDLLLEIIPSLMKHSNSQLVILGSGDPSQEKTFEKFSQKYPTRISTSIGFNDGLARRIFGGSDFFLMPSRFEPCGLTQQYAMRYGSIPIARKTGGLSDTITTSSKDLNSVNGFLFQKANQEDFQKVIHKALLLFNNYEDFSKVRKNAMKSCFSWTSAAKKYAQIYSWALEKNSNN